MPCLKVPLSARDSAFGPGLVGTPLPRVAQACEDYGVRVQKSVFECQVGQTEWARLRERLLKEIKADEDSLRFYFLDEKAVTRTEHHGTDKPVDLTEPLIL